MKAELVEMRLLILKMEGDPRQGVWEPLKAVKGGNRIPQRTSKKKLSPVDPVTLAQCDLCQTSERESCERVSLSYFELPNLW